MIDQSDVSSLSGIDSLVMFDNNQGKHGRGTLVHITRTTVVFEVYNPYSVVQLSEVLPSLQIMRGERLIYKGRAVVNHILTTGIMIIVSATLVDAWSDLSGLKPGGPLGKETERFINDWASSHSLRPKYQLIINSMRSFLSELSRWLEGAEVEFHDNITAEDSEYFLEEFYQEVKSPIAPKVRELFEHFEEEAAQVGPEEIMVHKAFSRRELHPLIMCSPFVERSYNKPLGYAGDYEMINMILETSTAKATSVYANIVDSFHIETACPEAHRNRVVMLEERLVRESSRVINEEERMLTVLNIGCGPALEVQRFIRKSEISNQISFHLMDFNDETLAYAQNKIEAAIADSGNKPMMKFTHKSIDELLMEANTNESEITTTFDMVYCAGLFDYFSQQICKRLVALFYSWLKPNGLVTVTNVHACNPNRYHMEHLLEWHLVYRDNREMIDLAPKNIEHEISVDETGVNVFLDVRKMD